MPDAVPPAGPVDIARSAPSGRGGAGPRRTVRHGPLPVAAALGVLGAAHLLRHRMPSRAATPVSLAATAALLLIARGVGHSAADLGMDPRNGAARRGTRYGVGTAGIVAAGYTAGVLLPATRPLFADQRAARDLPGVLRQALVEVPLRTVALEETGFRAVLPALLRGAGAGERSAAVIPVALFGLWHILPSRALADANPALAAGGRRSVAAAGSVAATAAGGALFAALRHRSGSVLAPALLHTAVNSLGFAAAWAVNRRPGPVARSRPRRA